MPSSYVYDKHQIRHRLVLNYGDCLLQVLFYQHFVFEGTGLGAERQGITAPIGRGQQSADKKGLGVNNPHNLEQGDDEFDAYRKRMMMAYRFRPNPLNNPRRAYY
jgi:splicing factor 4